MGYGDALLDAGDPGAAIDAYTTAEGWYRYNLVVHIDSFSAPPEGWAMTGMPGRGLVLHALQVAIQTAQQQEKKAASHAS
jgi:hypothetical protein